jgi:hypothetical protein
MSAAQSASVAQGASWHEWTGVAQSTGVAQVWPDGHGAMGGHAETGETTHANPFEQSLSCEHVVSARAAPGRTKAAPAIKAAMDVRTDGMRVGAREVLWVIMGKVAPMTRCIRPVRESRPGSP